MSQKPEQSPRHLVIGQILRPHGVRGELRVRVLTQFPERFINLAQVSIGHAPDDEATLQDYEVDGARLHKEFAILKLAGLEDRDSADRLREQFVVVALEDAIGLDEGEYYHFQLIGLQVLTDNDDALGEVVEILETGANDVYVVQSPIYGEILIPAIESVIQKIDLQNRQIIITPISGLLPDRS